MLNQNLDAVRFLSKFNQFDCWKLFKSKESNLMSLIFWYVGLHNIWCIKFRSKHSSNTVLCLLRNLLHQTLVHNIILIQWNLDLRNPDLRKNLDLRKIVATTDYLVHKLFDLRKIFLGLMFDLRKKNFQKCWKIGTFWQF